MKERPILFSSEMVRAILDGRKTQTRRIIKRNWCDWIGSAGDELNDPGAYGFKDEYGDCWTLERGATREIPCPYGQVGDRLWVRETWKFELSPESTYEEFMRQNKIRITYKDGSFLDIDNDASIVSPGFHLSARKFDFNPFQIGVWKPSIHMPRIASRILLEITGVRVERLNGITGEDAISEGVKVESMWPVAIGDAYRAFKSLWEYINGVGSWDENPWVWVVEFKVLEVVG